MKGRVAFRSEKLCVSYGDRAALRDVDLRVSEGEIMALVGPSGCGKSSFLQSINRLTDLVPGCRVTGGAWLGDGMDILDAQTDLLELRRRVGMVFQRPNPLPVSIWRNLEIPLREQGVGRGEIGDIIEARLREVGLWGEVSDRLRRPAAGLSGGQQQRLCIARALALRPEIVLFDEPCSALDPISSWVVEEQIVQLRGRVTVVIVTHNLAQARRIADRAAVFWVREGAGQVIEEGTSEEVFGGARDPDAAGYVSGERG
jgi:phosphate transport system ATP-binding protein